MARFGVPGRYGPRCRIPSSRLRRRNIRLRAVRSSRYGRNIRSDKSYRCAGAGLYPDEGRPYDYGELDHLCTSRTGKARRGRSLYRTGRSSFLVDDRQTRAHAALRPLRRGAARLLSGGHADTCPGSQPFQPRIAAPKRAGLSVDSLSGQRILHARMSFGCALPGNHILN